MPTPTYDLIASTTLAASSPEVVFGSLPQGYRDLILVVFGKTTIGANLAVRPNNDTGLNYALVRMFATSGGPGSSSGTAENYYYVGGFGTTLESIITLQIMDYSATDKHKTALAVQDIGADTTMRIATRWANTSAITSLVLAPTTGQFSSGSTFSLYGVIA
jgi:hypothetical protein